MLCGRYRRILGRYAVAKVVQVHLQFNSLVTGGCDKVTGEHRQS